MPDDTKDIQIAGCLVHLTYQALDDGRWTVVGVVRCGIEEQIEQQSVATGPCATREAAEKDALERVSKVLGNNVDRSTSRVKNRS
ncbi:MAG: hypothetical protein H0X01_02250 [Nitrospira sp.]|nr:hypothetical protein [Nitrospira sp.]